MTAGAGLEGDAERLAVGDRVLAHGYALGMSHHGGYAQYARVPAEWVVPLEGLSPREAMTIGDRFGDRDLVAVSRLSAGQALLLNRIRSYGFFGAWPGEDRRQEHDGVDRRIEDELLAKVLDNFRDCLIDELVVALS